MKSQVISHVTEEHSTNGYGPSAVSARGIARHYGQGDTTVHALRGVDVDVQPGRLTAVMGPSGAG